LSKSRILHHFSQLLAELQSNKAKTSFPHPSQLEGMPFHLQALNFPSTDSHKSCTTSIRNHTPSESRTESHLVESSHRLISTSNLHLKECSCLSVASFLRTLHLCLVCIIPSSGSTEHIFFLFSCEGLAFVVPFLEDVLVGTSLTFESIYGFMRVTLSRRCRSSRGNGEDIAAGGADWFESLVWCLVHGCRWESNSIQSNILNVYVNLTSIADSEGIRRARTDFLILTRCPPKNISPRRRK